MLTPEAVEIGLISAIKELGDLRVVRQAGVAEEHFLIYGEVFGFMEEYSKVYEGHLPKQKAIEERFSDTDIEITLLTDPGDLGYYIDELMGQYTARRLSQAVQERFGQGGMNLREDPYGALAGLTLDLRGLQPKVAKHVTYLDKDALSRLDWAQEKLDGAAKGEVGGMPTGLICFDAYYQGWGAGEAIMVIGPKGSGKSWLLMKFACVSYAAGNKILLISPEMSAQECGLRFDVVLASQFRKEFSHDVLSAGQFVDMGLYERWLSKLKQRDDFICVDGQSESGLTLEDLLGLMDEHRPDLMIVDGIQLIYGDDGQAGWEVIKQTADGLKNAAQFYGSVVIWAGQPNMQGLTNKNEPVKDIVQVGYGKSAVEAANRLITIAEDPDSKFRRTFRVPYNRSGKTWDDKLYMKFDVNVGRIEQIDFEVPQDFEKDPAFR